MARKDGLLRQIGLLVLLALSLVQNSTARCPNACSGHGTCGQNNVCACFDGWGAGAADCSMRSCPEGPAWADKAYATDKAHLDTECSNAGLCNRATGTCQCFEGFTGSACQRSRCPNDCSGHGSCATIADVAYFYGNDYDHDIDSVGNGAGIVYSNWDKDSVTMCECDAGFFSADCGLRMCPKGDDPLTINQNYKKIGLNLNIASGSFGGKLGFTFMGVTTYIDFDTPTNAQCKTALESNVHLGTVLCEITATDATNYDLVITFYTWPTMSRANNLFSHDGNPALTDFYCDAGQWTGATVACDFTDVQSANIREYAYCSNRGNCDFETGLCSCHTGYGGASCSNVTYFAGNGANSQPGFQVLVDGLDYQGDALQVRSAKARSPDFYLIEAIADKERMFFVRGDGAVGFTSLITPGGVTVSAGGLYVARQGVTVAAGGLTITDDGLTVASDVSETNQEHVGKFTMTETGYVPESVATLEVNSDSSSPHNLLEGNNAAGETVFEMRNTGETRVHAGGLKVTGGLSVLSDGLTVSQGITVTSNGMHVNAGGITVNEGSIKAYYGMHVIGGGIQLDSGGIRVNAAGGDFVAGGLRVHGGVSELKSGVKVTGGLTMYQGGLAMTGGLTVNNNGIAVTAGGVQVVADGIDVTGGLTVQDVGVAVGGGGIDVTGGLTVQDVGLEVIGGGIDVTGGISVQDTGVTVTLGGIDVTGGITVNTDGIDVTLGGIDVTGGVTVQDVGLQVIGGGVDVTGGLTVNDNGISVVAGGLQVTGGLTIYGTGLTLDGTTFTGATNGVYTDGGTEYVLTTSDRRLKRDLMEVQSSGSALDRVNQLTGVYYHWIDSVQVDKGYSDRRHIGFVAQDVMDVIPEAVHEIDDAKHLAIDYAQVVPVLAEGIKELSAASTLVEKSVSELKEQLTAFDARLRMLEEAQQQKQ